MPRRPPASRRRATALRRPPASSRRATAPRRPRPSRPRRPERSSRRSLTGSRSPVVLAAGDSRRSRAQAPTTSSHLVIPPRLVRFDILSRILECLDSTPLPRRRRIGASVPPSGVRPDSCARPVEEADAPGESSSFPVSFRYRSGAVPVVPPSVTRGWCRCSGRCFQGRRAVSRARLENLADCSGGRPRAGKAALSEAFDDCRGAEAHDDDLCWEPGLCGDLG